MSKPTNADGMSRAVEEKTINGLVPWYLMASVMYYHFDAPILSDARFDEIAKTLKANWPDIQHQHKHFITEQDLEAGSHLAALENYPSTTRAAAWAVGRDFVSLTDAQIDALLRTPFEPPERLLDSSLYLYDGMRTWAQFQAAAQKEISERVAKLEAAGYRVVDGVNMGKAPEVRVRSRARPAPAPEAESPAPVRVRTRVRPS